MKNINCPKKISLAQLPTPVHKLNRLSELCGINLYVKRDDLTGISTSGNKVRKLEYLFYDALNNNANTIITCGGIQSNHARATACVAVQLGLKPVLILRGNEPPVYKGNLLLNKMLGADIVWITSDEYDDIDTTFDKVKTKLAKNGGVPYVIPEGGSNSVGIWGYYKAVEEIIEYQSNSNVTFDTIVHATGSGGTHAGLILGKKIFNLSADIVSFNVAHNREIFTNRIYNIVKTTIDKYNLKITIDKSEINIVDGYVGPGYAQIDKTTLSELIKIVQKEALFFDTVYTGKALLGLINEIKKNANAFGKNILFIHTGGIFGLFAEDELISSILKSNIKV